jgi:hypothetical protein
MISLFISYAREDLEWCRLLEHHLGTLKSGGVLEVFYDQHLTGDDWNGEISDRLDSASIIVLLVSEFFISKEYCVLETERALQLWEEKKCSLVRVSLRKCKTEFSGFDFLQATPPPDQPIDGSAWPDKSIPFTAVVDKIADHAKEMTGVERGYKLAHRHRKRLEELLHNYCDRAHQRDCLIRAYMKEREKCARPFAIVLSGSFGDMPDNFRSRLRDVLIPELLRDNPALLTPMILPESGPMDDAFELFRYNLAPSFGVPLGSSMEEINRALSGKLPISLLPSDLPARLWKDPKRAKAITDAYFRLWEEWPALPSNVLLIPILTFRYSGNELWDNRARTYLSKLDFRPLTRLAGVVLPPLPLVEVDDFTSWLLHELVQPLIDSPRATREAENLPFPSAMDRVAYKNLPELLRRI